MNRSLQWALLMAAVGLGCSNLPVEETLPGDVAASTKQRITTGAPTADLEKAVAGQNDLAFDLLREIPRDAKGNVFFSPYSVSTALAMASAGAAKDTAVAFEEVLGSGLSFAAYHRAMNDLDAQLTSRGANAQGADAQPFRLKTANQIFAQKGFSVEAPFLDLLATEYGANVRLLDFEGASEPSRVAINDWVATKTEDKIENLLAEGTVNNQTRVVLVNAIYFNAAWAKRFDKSLTQNDNFNRANGAVSVPFMNAQVGARAATVDGVEVCEIPYDGGEMSMWVMMPPLNKMDVFLAELNQGKLSQYGAALKGENLDLSFPKFETNVRADLKGPLKKLGLEVAFDSGLADFSGITQKTRLYVSDVVHQALVKVNEDGTEAAAATSVNFGVTSVGPAKRSLKVDRSFVFAVFDNATGALVFLGLMGDPS
jgi:serpin B